MIADASPETKKQAEFATQSHLHQLMSTYEGAVGQRLANMWVHAPSDDVEALKKLVLAAGVGDAFQSRILQLVENR